MGVKEIVAELDTQIAHLKEARALLAGQAAGPKRRGRPLGSKNATHKGRKHRLTRKAVSGFRTHSSAVGHCAAKPPPKQPNKTRGIDAGGGGHDIRLRHSQGSPEQWRSGHEGDDPEAEEEEHVASDRREAAVLDQNGFESVHRIREGIDDGNRAQPWGKCFDWINGSAGKEQKRIQNPKHCARH